MSEIEKIKRYIDKTKFNNDRYSLLFDETIKMAHFADDSPIEAVLLAFNYGRAKGYRAAKAEAAHE